MAQAIASPPTRAIPTLKPTKLRELGIYQLPDSREFVVSTLYSDGCCLYPASVWTRYGSAEYWVDASGRLLNRGEPTRWRVQDLRDTGRTAAYPKPTLL
jgi:hypothetical protein